MSDVTVDNQVMQQEQAATPPDNVINLTDLQNVLVIIDLASNRGAFRGNELEPIGQLYNKIGKFVQAALPPAPEAAAGQTAETQGA